VHNFVEDRVREQRAEEEKLKRESANPTAG
jgi:hypothetical protein